MNQWACQYCNRTYAHQTGLSRHKKTCAIAALETKPVDVTENSAELNNIINSLLKRMNRMEEELTYLRSIKNSTGNTNTINTSIIAPNTSNTLNVTINKFGIQDRSYLNERFLNTCVRQKGQGIVELAKATHFHPDHEENHNIRAESVSAVEKRNRLQIHNGKQWDFADLRDILKQLFNANYQILDEHLNDNADMLRTLFGEHTFKIIDQWYDNMRNCDPEKSKEFRETIHKLKLMIMSNSGLT